MIFSFDHDPDEYREDPQATKTHALIGYARISTGDSPCAVAAEVATRESMRNLHAEHERPAQIVRYLTLPKFWPSLG
jgi:hypothetical protein